MPIMEKNEVRISEKMLNKLGQLKKRLPINVHGYLSSQLFVAIYLDDLPEIFKIETFFSIISARCFCRYDVMAVRRRYINK